MDLFMAKMINDFQLNCCPGYHWKVQEARWWFGENYHTPFILSWHVASWNDFDACGSWWSTLCLWMRYSLYKHYLVELAVLPCSMLFHDKTIVSV